MTQKQFKTRLSNQLKETFSANGTWKYRTFYSYLCDRVEQFPNKTVFTDAHGKITYLELKDKIDRCATYFANLGIKENDVVTIQFPNRIEFAVVFFSLELLGAIANTISQDFRKREVEYIIKFSKSRAYICASSFKNFDYVQMISEIQKDAPTLEIIVVSGSAINPATNLTFHSLEDGLRLSAPMADAQKHRVDPDAIMRMAFTSGTTGDPKGVMHSFNTTLYAAELVNREMLVTQDEVFLVWLPVGLNWGYLTLVQTILAGASALLFERFHAETALQLIETHRCTFIPTAPASLVAILNVPDFQKYDCSSLRVVVTGGASAAIETIRDYQKFMKGHLIELYGMLETGFHTFTRFDDDPQIVNGTIGRVVGEMGLRIIDEEGRDVNYGEVGEIAAYGPSVHLGYYNNPTANLELFTKDDWFRTGDLAKYVDQAGNVMIVGRRKEIINRGGKKFFPREIEEILYTHPCILHPAMVGVADERLGEKNCLCVVLKPNATLSLEDCVDFLKGQVADYKLPEMLQIFDELPFTPTGKIRRHVLTEEVKKRL
jgi:non-ribosomal peptide synthetase component E (peptide arylation enzyme)